MEQSQISLERVYEKLIKLERFMQKMDNYLADLEFARLTEESWQEIEQGKGKTYSPKEFKKRLNG